MNETQFYRVVKADGHGACDKCGQGQWWTIVYADGGEEIEIGQSWADNELAVDICDLMNMAFEQGAENDPYIRPA